MFKVGIRAARLQPHHFGRQLRVPLKSSSVRSKLFCSAGPVDESVKTLIYKGPFGGMLSRLKKVSIFSCCCTIIGVPLLSAFGNEKMSGIQRAAVGFTVVAFAIGTTATLHFVCKPYVTKLYLIQGTKSVELHTLNLIGRPKITRVESLAEVSPAGDRIFSSFQNREGMPFYVHEEADMWADTEFHKELMEIVQPEEEELEEQ
mmetsp:Transcript_1703/g.2420  ORF Transcript_1703/g.2420 Transcript_1703/m.2420 type:complete len:203 (+) Transcript_1703:234-842(+)